MFHTFSQTFKYFLSLSPLFSVIDDVVNIHWQAICIIEGEKFSRINFLQHFELRLISWF